MGTLLFFLVRYNSERIGYQMLETLTGQRFRVAQLI